MDAIKATYNVRIEAYRKLLLDTKYEHRMLSEIFRIDVNKKETDEEWMTGPLSKKMNRQQQKLQTLQIIVNT